MGGGDGPWDEAASEEAFLMRNTNIMSVKKRYTAFIMMEIVQMCAGNAKNVYIYTHTTKSRKARFENMTNF